MVKTPQTDFNHTLQVTVKDTADVMSSAYSGLDKLWRWKYTESSKLGVFNYNGWSAVYNSVVVDGAHSNV